MVIVAVDSPDEVVRNIVGAHGILAAGTAWVPLPDGRASQQTRYQVGICRVLDIACGTDRWLELHGTDTDTVLTIATRLGLDPAQCQEKHVSRALPSHE